MWLGLKVVHIALRKSETHREGLGLQSGQRAIVKTTAITQTITTCGIPNAWHKQQGRHDDFSVLRFWNAIGILFHRTAGVPRMERECFVHFVDHWQANAAQLRLTRQLAIFFPAVQCGQRIKLALNGPIRANDHLGPAKQPNAHDALKGIHPFLAICHVEARVQQVFANLFFGF